MRIAIYSDSMAMSTGYGQNTYNLVNALTELGHDAISIAIGHMGEPVRYRGLEIYPGATPYTIIKSLKVFKADVLMHIRDNWVFIPKYSERPYSLLEVAHAAGAKLINYTPVQAAPLPPEFVDSIDKQSDFTFITNQYGVDWLVKQGAPKEKLECLYNGVDRGVFNYLENTVKPTVIPKGKKMPVFVGANMDYRKEIPLALLAFKKYLQRRDDSIFYLHTNPFGGFDLPLYIKNLGLEGRALLKSNDGMKLMTWDFTTNEMNGMYNVGDAFLSLTASEGFNEPALEAAAVGLPLVLTDTPIHREIFGRFGEQVQFVKSIQELPTVWGYEWFADTQNASELLEKALDRGKRPPNAEVLKQFAWRKIAAQVVERATDVVGRKSTPSDVKGSRVESSTAHGPAEKN